jgi:hypothetical protein
MKILVFLIIFIFSPLFVFSQQSIDTSQYQESKMNAAYDRSTPAGSRFKSTVHFLSVDSPQAIRTTVWFADDTAADYMSSNIQLPHIEKGQVVIIYYRIWRVGNISTELVELEYIELTNEYFIVGNKYEVKDNLRLRTREGTSGDIILTIPKFAEVIILEIGKREDVIDGITSVWVKVNYNGTIGWCFGGYIHNHVTVFSDIY